MTGKGPLHTVSLWLIPHFQCSSESTLNNEQAPAGSTWGSVLQEKESTPHSAPLGTADNMHPSLSLLLVRNYGRYILK